MASVVMGGVAASMEFKETLTGDSTGNLKGKPVTHWSFKLFVAGSVVGVIAAVAGIVLGLYGLAIAAVILAVTNIISSVYVKKFYTYKRLEGFTNELKLRIRDLVAQVKILKTNIETFKDQNTTLAENLKSFEGIPENYKEEARRSKELIEEMIVKYENAQKKIEKLTAVIEKMKNVANSLSEKTLQFSRENGFMGEKVDKLHETTGELKDEGHDFAEKIKELDVQTDEFEELNNIFAKQIDSLEDLFDVMEEMFTKTKERVSDLEKEVQEFSVTVPEAVEATRKLGEMTVKYEEVANTVRATVDKLKRCKRYKEGYKKWNEWLNSDDKKKYEDWKKSH